MAPGDLNLKKSWHPGLIKNQQRVWEKEQEALLERKKIHERQEEIAKEKELAELRALQRKKGEKNVIDRVDWMYDAPGVGDGRTLITNMSEEYLLGRRKVDELITSGKSNNNKVPRKAGGFEEIEKCYQLSQKDRMNISREDPILKIQQQRIKKLEEKRLDMRLKEHKKQSSDGHCSHSSQSENIRIRETKYRYDNRKGRLHRSRDGEHRDERYQDRDRHRDGRDDREIRHRDSRRRERSHDRYHESSDYQHRHYKDRN